MSTCEKDKLWRDSNPFSRPPGGEKGVPGVLHQPIYQAYKGGLNMGLTRPITASTGACAACNKPYQVVGGSPHASAFSFSDVDVGDAFQFINHIYRRFASRQRIVLFAAKRRKRRLRLKKEGLAGREPTTYGFERQRLTPTPLRPALSCLLSGLYDL